MTDVSGFAAAGFEPVRESFAAQLAREGAGGAAVCVYFRGEPVVERAAWALGVQRDPFGGFGMGGLGGHLGMGQRAHRMGFGFVRSRLALDDAAGELLVAVAKSVALLT